MIDKKQGYNLNALTGSRRTDSDTPKLEVLFQPYGKRIVTHKNSTILEAAQAAGVDLRSTCGGRGECGKCRVILRKGQVKASHFHDEKFLTHQERLEGYHIACKTKILNDLQVEVPLETRLEKQQILSNAVIPRIELHPKVVKVFLQPSIFTTFEINTQLLIEAVKKRFSDSFQVIDFISSRALPDASQGLTVTVIREDDRLKIVDVKSRDTSERIYGLAIDIGTTKVVAYLVNLKDGSIIGIDSEYNTQLLYGEDLISRIDYAITKKDNLDVLQKAVINTINQLIDRLTSRSQIETHEIIDICIAGNTVMTYLLVKQDPKPLNYSRTIVSRTPITIDAKKLGVKANRNASIFCMPNVSRWLGGDTVANIIASGLYESQTVSVLIDMGTNGEIVIGSSGWLFSTSCASGPAFEGYEIRFGMRSVEGAIEHVKIDRKSLKSTYKVIGEPRVKPKGICGSGIIDLTAEMFEAGILDTRGHIQRKDSTLIKEDTVGLEYIVVPADETDLNKDITITQKDIDKFLDSKAATCAAVSVLMQKVGLTISEVDKLYLSGAFGHYLDTEKAVTIGVFPEFPKADTIKLGNGSIAGAYLGLISSKKREKAADIAKKITYWDLVDDPLFTDEYYAALLLPGKPELFPTIINKISK